MNKKDRNSLRQNVLTKRDGLSSSERAEKSISITSRCMDQPEVANARIFLIYMHFRSEVQTLDIINHVFGANKTVTIPFTKADTSHLAAIRITDLDQQVAPGYCGIPEPIPELVQREECDPMKIDTVIVPGSVFDRSGGRMGYGGGYYDRFLANEAPDALRIGLAYELQLVDKVPCEPHDQFMDFIVTEENIYDCRRR